MVYFAFVKSLYVQEFATKHGTEPSVDSELDCDTWVEASGGSSKGRIYGFGNTYRAREVVGSSSVSQFLSSSMTYPPITEEALKDALKKFEDENMAKQREETTSLLEEIKRREEAAKKREDDAKTLMEQLNKQKQDMEDLMREMRKNMEKQLWGSQ